MADDVIDLLERNERLQALNAELLAALKVADKIMDVMWPVFEPHRPDHGGSPCEWMIEGFSQIETVLKKAESQ